MFLEKDNFCPRCAAPLERKAVEGRQRPVCSLCGRVIYYDPKLAAAGVVERKGQVLMVRRATEPGKGLWSLPGGYVERGEVVEAAVVREAQEETGLEVRVRRLVGLFSEPGDPVVLAAYEVEATGGDLNPGSEVSELGFFSLDALPLLAFPRDRQVLQAWQDLA